MAKAGVNEEKQESLSCSASALQFVTWGKPALTPSLFMPCHVQSQSMSSHVSSSYRSSTCATKRY